MNGKGRIVSFTRQQVNERLGAVIAAGRPIVMGGAGIGLIAKILDTTGIDIIMAYNTGPFRMDGHGSLAGYLAYGDSNQMTIDLGYSGITNVPTAGLYDGRFREHIDATRLGYPEEIRLIAECRARDVFTVAYAFSPDEARAMAAAGADIVGAHVGLTVGGMIGAKAALDLEEACQATLAMYEAAVAERSDVIVVAHGGPFDTPANARRVLETTPVHGYLGASSIERLPVEDAIGRIVAEFKALPLGRKSAT
jgi:predicted TIM-barrel enzyme